MAKMYYKENVYFLRWYMYPNFSGSMREVILMVKEEERDCSGKFQGDESRDIILQMISSPYQCTREKNKNNNKGKIKSKKKDYYICIVCLFLLEE